MTRFLYATAARKFTDPRARDRFAKDVMFGRMGIEAAQRSADRLAGGLARKAAQAG